MLSYFVEKSISFVDLASIGLAHICDDPNAFVCQQVINGPHGMSYAVGSTETIGGPRIGNYPARQEVKHFGKFAIARDTEAAINPECLRRSNSIKSHPWQDWSGNTWQIPIAQRWIDGNGNPMTITALPRYISIGDSGEWEFGGVLPKHEKLWELANRFYSERLKASEEAEIGTTFSVPIPSIDDVCDVVFGANYRVSRYELSFLKTLLPESIYEVMKLVIDEPGFMAIQKKTD